MNNLAALKQIAVDKKAVIIRTSVIVAGSVAGIALAGFMVAKTIAEAGEDSPVEGLETPEFEVPEI